MLKINYSKDGTAFSDFKVEQYVMEQYNKIVSGEEIEVEIVHSTENVQYATRALIEKDLIPGTIVKFYYEGEDVHYDFMKNEFTNLPLTYCSAIVEWNNTIYRTS